MWCTVSAAALHIITVGLDDVSRVFPTFLYTLVRNRTHFSVYLGVSNIDDIMIDINTDDDTITYHGTWYEVFFNFVAFWYLRPSCPALSHDIPGTSYLV